MMHVLAAVAVTVVGVGVELEMGAGVGVGVGPRGVKTGARGLKGVGGRVVPCAGVG